MTATTARTNYLNLFNQPTMTTTTNPNRVEVTDFILRQLETEYIAAFAESKDVEDDGRIRLTYNETARIQLAQDSQDEATVSYSLEWIGFDDDEDDGRWVYPEAVYITERHVAPAPALTEPECVDLPDHQVMMEGRAYDFDALVNMMDDEVRERVHCIATKKEMSSQEFTTAYCMLHLAKHKEKFTI